MSSSREGFNHTTVFDAGIDRLKTEYPPLEKVSQRIVGVRTDEELGRFQDQNKDKTSIVQWGASWCVHCKEIFPVFKQLSEKFNNQSYGLAQIDTMIMAGRQVRYTPTFTVFKGRKKIDEFYGVDPQKLRDHMWLHDDD